MRLPFVRPFSSRDVAEIVRAAQEAGIAPGPEPSRVEIHHGQHCIGQAIPDTCSCFPAPDIVLVWDGSKPCDKCPKRDKCPDRR